MQLIVYPFNMVIRAKQSISLSMYLSLACLLTFALDACNSIKIQNPKRKINLPAQIEISKFVWMFSCKNPMETWNQLKKSQTKPNKTELKIKQQQ